MGAGAELDFRSPPGELPDASVSNAELASMAAGTVKLRALDAGLGPPIDGTGGQVSELVRTSTVQTQTLNSTTNDFALNTTTTVLRLLPVGAQTLTGMTGGSAGRHIIIDNAAGAGNTVNLPSLDSGSAATSRFRTPSASPVVIGFRESVTVRWDLDTSDWRFVSRAPAHISPIVGNQAVPFNVYVSCPSGGAAGTADDVTVWNANAPFALRILDATLRVSTAVGGSTAALRTASGGGGSVVLPDPAAATQTFSTAAVGPFDDVATATATVASGGSLFLRRSDRSVVGELILTCIRT